MEIEATTQGSATPVAAHIDGQQFAIISWLPYRTGGANGCAANTDCNDPASNATYPYDEWLQPTVPKNVSNAVLQIRVRKVDPSTASFGPSTTPTMTISYSAPKATVYNTTGTFDPSQISVPESPNGKSWYLFQATWPTATTSLASLTQPIHILDIGLPVDDPATNIRSVKLNATLTVSTLTSEADVSTRGAASSKVPKIVNVKSVYFINDTESGVRVTWDTQNQLNQPSPTAPDKDTVVRGRSQNTYNDTKNFSAPPISPGADIASHTFNLVAIVSDSTPAAGTYHYRARSVDSDGNPGYSEDAPFDWPPAVTITPGTRSASFTTTGSGTTANLTLNWTVSRAVGAAPTVTVNHGATDYNQSVTPSCPASGNVLNCTAIIPNITVPVTSYKIRITATNSNATTLYETTSTLTPSVTVSAVKSTTTINGSNLSVKIDWNTTNTGAGATNVISLNGGAPITVSCIANPCSNTFTLSTIPATYNYSIVSTPNGGSPTTTTDSLQPLNVPAATFQLNTNTPPDGGTLTWTTVNATCSINGISLPGGTNLAITPTFSEPTTNHSFTAAGFTNIAVDTTFDYDVTCTAGSNTTIRRGSFTIPDNVAPTITLAATAVTNIGTNSATLNWNTTENAQCSISSPAFTPNTGSFSTTISTGTQSHSVNMTGLTTNQAYSVDVTISCKDARNNTSTQIFNGTTFHTTP